MDRIEKLKTAISGAVNKGALGPYVTNADPRQGYQAYNLDTTVVHFYDTYTPLLGYLAREGGQNGSGANWKLVRRLKNVADLSGVPEGARGQIVQVDQIDRFEPFATLSKDQSVTVEASLASQGLSPDAQASAADSLTEIFLQHEHKNIINGLRTSAIARPVIVGANATVSGGSLAAATSYDIVAVALSFEAWENYNATGLLPATVAANMADGTAVTYNGGTSQASIADTVAVSGNAIEAAVSNPGITAAGYAWFIAVAAGTPALAGVSSEAAFTFTATSVSAIVSTTFAADRSTNAYTFNGILAQLPFSGAVLTDNGAAGLTPTFAGGIAEIDKLLKDQWTADRVIADKLFVSPDMSDYINRVLLSQGNTGASRITVLRNADGTVEGGMVVTSYRHPIQAARGGLLQIETLVDLAPGTILAYCSRVAGARPDVKAPTAVLLAQDYLLEVYAKTRRTYEMGMSTIGCVAVRYGPAWAGLYNVAIG